MHWKCCPEWTIRASAVTVSWRAQVSGCSAPMMLRDLILSDHQSPKIIEIRLEFLTHLLPSYVQVIADIMVVNNL